MKRLSTISGRGVSSGRASGLVQHVLEAGQERTRGDVILVTKYLTPDLINCIDQVNGVISENGGAVCHAAVILREFGIPVVVGIDGALSLLKENTRVIVDGDSGQISILE